MRSSPLVRPPTGAARPLSLAGLSFFTRSAVAPGLNPAGGPFAEVELGGRGFVRPTTPCDPRAWKRSVFPGRRSSSGLFVGGGASRCLRGGALDTLSLGHARLRWAGFWPSRRNRIGPSRPPNGTAAMDIGRRHRAIGLVAERPNVVRGARRRGPSPPFQVPLLFRSGSTLFTTPRIAGFAGIGLGLRLF